jgi:ER lumen protein retaining receptor
MQVIKKADMVYWGILVVVIFLVYMFFSSG